MYCSATLFPADSRRLRRSFATCSSAVTALRGRRYRPICAAIPGGITPSRPPDPSERGHTEYLSPCGWLDEYLLPPDGDGTLVTRDDRSTFGTCRRDAERTTGRAFAFFALVLPDFFA